jgi:hypothetical protein
MQGQWPECSRFSNQSRLDKNSFGAFSEKSRIVVLLMALSLEIRRIRAFVLTIALAIAAIGPCALAADAPNEYQIKAVMLFNLTHFVDWPADAFADANSPIIIGIVGRNPFGHYLEAAGRGETVNGRRIVIRNFTRSQAIAPCHIVFICANEKPKLDQIFSKLKGRPVLTVSEIEQFSSLPGGMILFHTNSEKKIKLRLNLESARSAGLNISSKLIQVAEPDKTSLVEFPRPREVAVSPDKFGDFGTNLIQ